jgi:hypothetical protein
LSAEDFEGIKEHAKQVHSERVAKNPDRVEYAIKQFEENNIEYTLKNPSNGHFHAWDMDGNLHQFWASTGKIMDSEKRGIHNFIKILKMEES